MLTPWLMQVMQEQRKERKSLLAARESRVRVKSGNGVALAHKGHRADAAISQGCEDAMPGNQPGPQDVVADASE